MNGDSIILRFETIIGNMRRICSNKLRPDRLIAINPITQGIKYVHADSLDHVTAQASITRIIGAIPYINPIFTVEHKLGVILPRSSRNKRLGRMHRNLPTAFANVFNTCSYALRQDIRIKYGSDSSFQEEIVANVVVFQRHVAHILDLQLDFTRLIVATSFSCIDAGLDFGRNRILHFYARTTN